MLTAALLRTYNPLYKDRTWLGQELPALIAAKSPRVSKPCRLQSGAEPVPPGVQSGRPRTAEAPAADTVSVRDSAWQVPVMRSQVAAEWQGSVAAQETPTQRSAWQTPRAQYRHEPQSFPQAPQLTCRC